MDPKISGYVAIGSAVVALLAIVTAFSASSDASAVKQELQDQMKQIVRRQIKSMDKDVFDPLRDRFNKNDDLTDKNRRAIEVLDGKWQSNAQVKDEMIAHTTREVAKANQHTSTIATGLQRDIKAAREDANRYADTLKKNSEKKTNERIESLENKLNRELKIR